MDALAKLEDDGRQRNGEEICQHAEGCKETASQQDEDHLLNGLVTIQAKLDPEGIARGSGGGLHHQSIVAIVVELLPGEVEATVCVLLRASCGGAGVLTDHCCWGASQRLIGIDLGEVGEQGGR